MTSAHRLTMWPSEMRQHLEVVVGADGAVCVPASEVARLGARPGERLHLVREGSAPLTPDDAAAGLPTQAG